MRFGELLLSTQIIEWADKYLSYNQLKCCINDIVKEKLAEIGVSPVSSPRLSAPATPRLDEQGVPSLANSAVPCHEKYASFHAFKDLLERDISTFESFYVEKLTSVQLELEYLSERQKRIKGAEKNPHLKARILQQYVECLKLENYARLNLLGLAKLLKKHDKLLQGNPFLLKTYMESKVTHLSISSSDTILAQVKSALERAWTVFGFSLEQLQQAASQDPSLAARVLPFDVADTYSTFLLDMDGVIYHGNHMLPGVPEFVTWLQEKDKKFLFLTNSSDKTPDMLSAKLAKMGIKVPPDNFFTSALATAAFLKQQAKVKTAYVIGDKGLIEALLNEGFVITDNSPEYVVVGETRDLNYLNITKAVNLVRNGSKLIGTNPDSVDKVENGFDPSVGSLIAPIQIATDVKPYFVGKPNPLMFLKALDKVQSKRSETVMIGDRMDTDIVGGLESNIMTILVLSGVTLLADMPKYQFRPHYILRGIDELVQVLFANSPSRKDLLTLYANYSDSLESLV